MVCASGSLPVHEVGGGPIPLSLLMRDMGNGVTRIEGPQLLDVFPALPFLEALDCTTLHFPLSGRVEDAVLASMAYLTVCGPPAYRAGCYRSLTETMTEYFFW